MGPCPGDIRTLTPVAGVEGWILPCCCSLWWGEFPGSFFFPFPRVFVFFSFLSHASCSLLRFNFLREKNLLRFFCHVRILVPFLMACAY